MRNDTTQNGIWIQISIQNSGTGTGNQVAPGSGSLTQKTGAGLIMVHVTRRSTLKKMLFQHIVWEAEKSNLLIRMLAGKSVTQDQIDQYQPMKEYRWSSRMDGASHFTFLTGDDALYNVIDKDLLLKLKEKN